MDSDTVLLLRLASVALPAFAALVLGSRCAMLAHDAKRRAGRDDSGLAFRDNWAVMRMAWRHPAGRGTVVGVLVSSVLALVAFVSWMRA